MRKKLVPRIATDIKLHEYRGCTFRLLHVINPLPSMGHLTPCQLDMRVNAMGYDHPHTGQVKFFLKTHKWAELIRERNTYHLIQHGHYARLQNPDRREHPEGGVWQYWLWKNGRWVLHECSGSELRLHQIFILVCVRELPEPTKITLPESLLMSAVPA